MPYPLYEPEGLLTLSNLSALKPVYTYRSDGVYAFIGPAAATDLSSFGYTATMYGLETQCEPITR